MSYDCFFLGGGVVFFVKMVKMVFGAPCVGVFFDFFFFFFFLPFDPRRRRRRSGGAFFGIILVVSM